MSGAETAILGAIAGLTIFLGLPVARARSLSTRARALLNATAAGILLFLLVEVVEQSIGPIEQFLEESVEGKPHWLDFFGHFTMWIALFAVGLLGLVYYDKWLDRRRRGASVGPGAAAVDEFTLRRTTPAFLLDDARRLAFFIALGIGLHNFSEGLAIGQSAASGEISLALVLIVGFALHNATEGFGIAGPLAGEADRPSWGFLAVLGLIGGLPVFVGTVIGQAWVSDTLFIGFLALAAGSILYVVVQLLRVAFRLGHEDMLAWGLVLGLVLGFATEFVIEAARHL